MDTATALVTLRVRSTQTLGHCPVCRCPTRRIHSRSTRTVTDLPWAHYRVVLQLSVRKFCCANGRCTRRIFTERLSSARPSARRAGRTTTVPGRQPRRDRGYSLLDPYKTALLERWNAGCRTAMQLFRDLQPRWPGPSTSPRTLPSSCASGSLSTSIPGCNAPPRARRRPCDALPRGSLRTMPRSKPV
jgi:zinc-finger of transposase IS204/IS1001/IS1096/IS1165